VPGPLPGARRDTAAPVVLTTDDTEHFDDDRLRADKRPAAKLMS
jgi:hypothetical protein